MKLLKILIYLVFMAQFATIQSIAETRYVSDSLTIFLRTGPTHQYRIVGTLQSGVAVEIIAEDAVNKASHIRLASGREVWVDTDQLMQAKPTSLLLSEAKKNLRKLSSSSKQRIDDLTLQLNQAKETAGFSQSLQKKVTQLEYDKELLEQKNQTLTNRSRYDLMTTGGIIALVGLLFGLILPRFIRRKRTDGWR